MISPSVAMLKTHDARAVRRAAVRVMKARSVGPDPSIDYVRAVCLRRSGLTVPKIAERLGANPNTVKLGLWRVMPAVLRELGK